VDCPVESISPILKGTFHVAHFSKERMQAAQPLVDSIVADARNFAAMLRINTIGFRFFVDNGELIRDTRHSLAHDPVDVALADWKESISYFGYDAAYVYHQDEHPVNQITCYSGPATLCLPPNVLTGDEWVELGRRWIDLTLSDDGLAHSICGALAAGERELAVARFDQLLSTMALQQQFAGEFSLGSPAILPFSFPLLHPCLYFGDAAILDPKGDALLMHARPMRIPEPGATPRVLCILEAPAGKDFRSLLNYSK
jgi:hypothetical protein